MMSSFIHLKVHSEYSIVDSVIRVDQLLQRIVDLKMPAVALTDEVNLFALIKFYREALNKGVKPIIGAELILGEDKELFRFSVLCKNQIGFRHLIQLLSRAYLEGRQCEQALIRWEWLMEVTEGLIILSGGRQGDVGQALLQNRNFLAEKRLARWLKYFPDRFYLELQRTQRDQEEEYIYSAVKLALAYNIPVVATNDVRFLHQEDFEAHEARVCIHQGYLLDDSNRPHDYSNQQYLKSTEEMKILFSDIPEALENTLEIAKRCNVQVSLGKVFLPKFPVPDNRTEEDFFHEQANRGLEGRLGKSKINNIYQERLEREIYVITKMGFAGYFLIVANFVAWAKKNDIPVGPGRGSGAGSLVAYSLGITELDPLKHELLFERFLNLERISMPDFDIDFCMEGRDRVIDYVAECYGHDAVAQIITYGTMAARAVLRDVGRVLGLPYGYVDKIAKLVPFELGMTLNKAMNQEKILAKYYAEDDEIKNLIDLAMKLEGLARNAGKHAGGVVIAPTKLTDFVPLYSEPNNGHVVTQFDKDDIEAAGLVKFDFLGLRTLTIIKWAVQSVNAKRKTQNKPLLDISTIPLDDKKTYKLLNSCATTAVFQLESRGMKELIRRLQPDNFSDIMALLALFRPGPLKSGMVDTFIACKHGKQTVHYIHPDIESILRSTYGVILYQEQVMQIAQVLAGYSLGAADILRHAMGKKKPEEMAKQRKIFIKGSTSRGLKADLANQIFDLMEKFSGYGFNKSHSAAYALIAYQTAWLKALYPAEFMAAVLSSDMNNTDKVVGFINECRKMGLELLPPSINRGQYFFTVNVKGQIEYGLGAIKGVGESAVLNIVLCREEAGEFKGLFDLCHRVDFRKVNRRVLEPLIRSGAMDVFGVPRSSLMKSLDKALQSAEQKNRNTQLGQNDLFDNELDAKQEEYYEDTLEWNDNERLRGEKKTLGLYVTGHPLQTCEKEIKTIGAVPINQLVAFKKNTIVMIAGMVLAIRNLITRSGKRMAILTLEDCSGVIEVTVFSELYQQVAEDLNKDTILIVRGSVGKDDFMGGLKIVANLICTLDKMREQAKRLLIRITAKEEVDQLLIKLPLLVKSNLKGKCPITIIYQGETASAELILGETWKVKPSEKLLSQLSQLCGKDKVELEYLKTSI
ncbi:DNA polymerase III subunit alpha [Coxiella endosymbiont of Rhipicephalus microplus]|uniref:DNA polymerase III subunit alpha n=1 Tax=Coxiella endosymbiont of Rhipicephalus microplus TaxID=1656186 RepID=UPI000C809AB0|nr:DNA polymerase III subunit alpha [Coxiella endosymbiont of Rhipicephalus microplus]